MEIKGVYRTFTTPHGKVVALEDISVKLPSHGIVGLLGPNGSGKTTLMRIIMGIIPPDQGEVLYEGHLLTAERRRQFGYMPEERGLYPKMTIRSQLLYFLRLRGMSRAEGEKEIAYWAKRLEMPWIDRPARTLSKGMQQKAQLALALAGQPKVLLLDEPFSGLDPIVSAHVEELLREMLSKGVLIILSTHRLEQVDHLCDYVLFLHKGRLILAGETAQIRKEFGRRTYEVELSRPVGEISLPEGVRATPLGTNRLELTLPEGLSGNAVLEGLLPQAEILFFTEKLPTVREIFLKAVGEG
ncbi:MAG: ATP-binding cassette domain-containing protein [Bacteroidia bacterium]|nr:ATP-binding cassette domain-containing protein [Bacteroidia bacterium]MCX7764084.1 ATP-binding cassette domain-containing protein [Bacteroidia bacterium]MDW8057866.1 ATP-binding cassette domain-containing protein [Bacteroidia bacterium]